MKSLASTVITSVAVVTLPNLVELVSKSLAFGLGGLILGAALVRLAWLSNESRPIDRKG